MNEFEIKPNSHKYKAEQQELAERKKVEKVTTGKVKTKPNEVRKFADIFISEDIQNVKSYIFMDVLVPAIKKAISDIVTDGIFMILYGGTGGNRKKSTNSSYVSYNSYSDRRDERREISTARISSRYDDIILESRAEAEEVLTRLDELIDMYGEASVADLYDLIGVSCNYTDNKYGWKNLSRAEVVRAVGGGYKLKLPRAIQLH